MILKYLELIIHVYNKFKFRMNKSIKFGKKLQIKHTPIVDIGKNSKLIIGNNVTLNSKNSTYHVNMFSPVKLLSKTKGSKIEIGDNTRIHGSCIHANKSIKIGKNCLIAGNCQIFDSSGHDMYKETRLDVSSTSKEIIIEDDVWIATGVIILPGTIIKKGSVVAAGSVVRGVFEEKSLISGNPALFIKKIVLKENNE